MGKLRAEMVCVCGKSQFGQTLVPQLCVWKATPP